MEIKQTDDPDLRDKILNMAVKKEKD